MSNVLYNELIVMFIYYYLFIYFDDDDDFCAFNLFLIKKGKKIMLPFNAKTLKTKIMTNMNWLCEWLAKFLTHALNNINLTFNESKWNYTFKIIDSVSIFRHDNDVKSATDLKLKIFKHATSFWWSVAIPFHIETHNSQYKNVIFENGSIFCAKYSNKTVYSIVAYLINFICKSILTFLE